MVGCDGKPRQNETWWDDVVDCAIKEKNYGKSGKKVEVYFQAKKDIFKQKKKSLQAKKKAKSTVDASRKSAQETKFSDL